AHLSVKAFVNIGGKYSRESAQPFLDVVIFLYDNGVIKYIKVGESVGVENQSEHNQNPALYFHVQKTGRDAFGLCPGWFLFRGFSSGHLLGPDYETITRRHKSKLEREGPEQRN